MTYTTEEVRPIYLTQTEAATIGDALQSALDAWYDSSPSEEDDYQVEITKHESLMAKVDALYKEEAT